MKKLRVDIQRIKQNRTVAFITKCLDNKFSRWFCGLPLLYTGVLIIIAHYLLHNTDLQKVPYCTQPCNWLLLLALALEIVGATCHYMKTNKRLLRNLLLPIITIFIITLGIIFFYASANSGE